jgi:hypothetical protein
MKLMNYITLAILTILIVVLVIFLVKVNSNGTRCMTNPLQYAIKIMSSENNSFSCICSPSDFSYSSIEANLSGTFYVSPIRRILT